ncbi:MAG: hypothetical protein JWN86_2288 [Planctomycetota bacterium]|nr:hypothetical protein [Planctomycetota bacterium]
MERTVTKALDRLVLAVLMLVLVPNGPGCSRMRTYRAQNSPLPGLPLLGRANRVSAAASPALAKAERSQNRANVAWSGMPNTAPALSRLDPPPGLNPDPIAHPPLSAKRDSRQVAATDPKPTAADPAVARVRALVQMGRENLGKMHSYQVAMTRQERVGDSLLPSEDVLLSIRREPRAIRLEWPTGSHKGREVLYSADEPGGLMHINMADSVIPIPKMTLATDSPLVMKNSRHPITEAGLDAILDRLDETLKPHEAGNPLGERLALDATVNPPEIGRPCNKVTRVTASGETWTIYLDAVTSIPTFVQATSPRGELLERYVFRNFAADPPALADAAAFDPERRWGSPRGLFGRLAQGASASNATR